MGTPFYLKSQRSGMALLCRKRRDLPDEVNGLPAFYYWKDGISVGEYVHPKKGFKLNITEDRLSKLSRNFQKMLSNGVAVPILKDHQEKADATLGYILDTKVEDGTLWELHQFLGEDARDIGLRNFVSLGIDPDFTDGRGKSYGEAIVHSAITPVPVIPGQQGFVSLSSSSSQGGERDIFELAATTDGGADMALAKEQLDRIKELLGGSDEVTADNAVDVLIEFASSLADKVKGMRKEPDGDEAIKTENADLKKQLSLLSRSLPDADSAGLIADGLTEKLDLLRDKGAISPACHKKLNLALLRDESGTINLSAVAGGSKSIAKAVLDALSDNRAIDLKTRTGVQTLSRTNPEGQEDAASAAEQKALQQRMAGITR